MNVRLNILIASLFLVLVPHPAKACIWDADTLSDEKKHSPKMAEVILGPAPKPANPILLRAKIEALNQAPRKNDPSWWNELAGAHLRLGEASEAAKLLEPVMAKFSNDYGLHANLGTAYHLLGRYVDAEREIAGDLELNPDGHFGLEKYHLALLQYLSRDAEYQKQHVYVDEFSADFSEKDWDQLSLMNDTWMRVQTTNSPSFPAYRGKWQLATDTNLENGVIYMAQLNPKEPACFVMLGIAALAQRGYGRDMNLAIAAFEKGVQLGSSQRELLTAHISKIESHISKSQGQNRAVLNGIIIFGVVVLALGTSAVLLIRLLVRKLKKTH